MGIRDILGRHGALRRVFCYGNTTVKDTSVKKYLIVGLGNIGPEYADTRHNVGFMAADAFARKAGAEFKSCRYGDMAQFNIKNCQCLLLKPSTFMNLSGVAVRYWMNKEKLPLENLIVIVDDIALPFGSIRLRRGGSDAGHNGLKNIALELGTQQYTRLRFGVGKDFGPGQQVNYVLGKFPAEEQEKLPERLSVAVDAIQAFCLSGIDFAMTHYNNK